MDPQQQALIAALMGGQSNVQPSAVAPQPQAQQFDPRMLGYGGQQQQNSMMQNPQQMMQQQIPGMYAQGMAPQQMGQ